MLAKMNNWHAWIKETRPDFLMSEYKTLLLDCGFNIVNECYHFFNPYGFTALILLTESHFAIHTFPEENKTYLELSSCVDLPFKRFIDAFNHKKGVSDIGKTNRTENS